MKDRFIEFLTNEFSRTNSVGKAYSNDKEMIEHFLSGEVNMPVTKMMEFFDSNECAKDHAWYPSRFAIDDFVKLNFGEAGMIYGCQVVKVHFTKSKVLYDVYVNNTNTRLYNIESEFVLSLYDLTDSFVGDLQAPTAL